MNLCCIYIYNKYCQIGGISQSLIQCICSCYALDFYWWVRSIVHAYVPFPLTSSIFFLLVHCTYILQLFTILPLLPFWFCFLSIWKSRTCFFFFFFFLLLSREGIKEEKEKVQHLTEFKQYFEKIRIRDKVMCRHAMALIIFVLISAKERVIHCEGKGPRTKLK